MYGALSTTPSAIGASVIFPYDVGAGKGTGENRPTEEGWKAPDVRPVAGGRSEGAGQVPAPSIGGTGKGPEPEEEPGEFEE